MSFASARCRVPGRAALLAAACALLVPALAGSQVSDAAADLVPPPVLSRVDGQVHLTRAAQAEEALANMPLVDGDRLAGAAGGRFAIRWPDGSRLFADERTTLDLVGPGRLRLVQGRVRIDLASGADALHVETPGGSVRVDGGARVEIRAADAAAGAYGWVGVDEGEAVATTDAGLLTIPAGAVADLRGLAGPRLLAERYVPPRDDFARWLAGEVDSPAADAAAGAPPLPEDVQPYADALAPYGTWGIEPGYGQVWYPAVGPDWRPYASGVWRHVGRFGWFWVGADPWAWPTHHFGRWGFSSQGRWFWVPRRGWSPAWVIWAVGPGFISWCPLGVDGGPVFGAPFWRGRSGPIHFWWRGWTTVPAGAFGSTSPVARVAIDGRQLGEPELGAFVVQRVPPFLNRTAVARGTWPPGSSLARPAGPRDARSMRFPPGTVGSDGIGNRDHPADRSPSASPVAPGTWSIPRGEAVMPIGRAPGTWTVPRGRQVMPITGTPEEPGTRRPVAGPRPGEPSPYERALPYMQRPAPGAPGTGEAESAGRPAGRPRRPDPGPGDAGAPPPAALGQPARPSAAPSGSGRGLAAPARRSAEPPETLAGTSGSAAREAPSSPRAGQPPAVGPAARPRAGSVGPRLPRPGR